LAGSIFYFGNLTAPDAPTDTGTVLLHPPANPFGRGRLRVHPPQFTFAFGTPVLSARLQLFDMQGNKIQERQTPAQQISVISLDFSDVEEGRYLLKTNGAGDYEFYLSGAAGLPWWGVVEIYAEGPGIPRTPRSGSNSAIQHLTTFAIVVEARTSYWRYYIVSQSPADRVYDDYQIFHVPPPGRSNGMVPVSFSEPVRQKLNGKEAWVFESADPIPLYQYPFDRHEFTLRSNARGNGFGRFSLPYARPEGTRLERASDGQIRSCSEIYVYL
jgi:hypothetical protein